MLRLNHLSGSMQGSSSDSPKALIKIGRGSDCDVRYDPTQDTKVSTHHAEIRFEGGDYVLYDTNSTNGTLVNGKKLTKPYTLSEGDLIIFGAPSGPQARFEIAEITAAPPRAPPRQATVDMSAVPKTNSGYAAPPPAPRAGTRSAPGGDSELAAIAANAAAKAKAARMSGNAVEGQTAFFMVNAMQEAVTKKTGVLKWWIAGITTVALLVIGGLLWNKHNLEAQIGKKEHAIEDRKKKIAGLQTSMQFLSADDPKLREMQDQIEFLQGGIAQEKQELAATSKDAAKKLEQQEAVSGDWLDQQLKNMLRKFEADTSYVPPLFKQRVQYYLTDYTETHRGTLNQIWSRKKMYWPMVEKAFLERGLPVEIAYVAWVESYFDPMAESQVGARGMWQFMPSTAKQYGLHVADNWKNGGNDERIDPFKESQIAAHYLQDLLSDFGEDSFPLAIASYNKGEDGMRKVLRKNGLWRKRDRDFWRLYQLKVLPEETLEYVPRILAAAIVGANPTKFGLSP